MAIRDAMLLQASPAPAPPLGLLWDPFWAAPGATKPLAARCPYLNELASFSSPSAEDCLLLTRIPKVKCLRNDRREGEFSNPGCHRTLFQHRPPHPPTPFGRRVTLSQHAPAASRVARSQVCGKTELPSAPPGQPRPLPGCRRVALLLAALVVSSEKWRQ